MPSTLGRRRIREVRLEVDEDRTRQVAGEVLLPPLVVAERPADVEQHDTAGGSEQISRADQDGHSSPAASLTGRRAGRATPGSAHRAPRDAGARPPAST